MSHNESENPIGIETNHMDAVDVWPYAESQRIRKPDRD